MKLFRPKTGKTHGAVETKPGRQATREEVVPKNGRLFLAVVGCFLVMIALGAVNIRLIGDPSAAMRAFGKASAFKGRAGNPYTPPVLSSGTGEKVCYVPPQLTFYRKLATQDEHDLQGRNALLPDSSHPADKTQTEGAGTDSRKDGPPKKDPRKAESTCVPRPTDQTSRPAALPRATAGKKRYTVQVGAFTQPGIARQWAARWKAKGYHVSLKPVARPATGVIHRLYLGDFSSARKADELVKRLKTKDGIDAFRLVLRH